MTAIEVQLHYAGDFRRKRLNVAAWPVIGVRQARRRGVLPGTGRRACSADVCLIESLKRYTKVAADIGSLEAITRLGVMPSDALQ
jgi:hypothetical protein